ncbi:hypothetical protein ACLB2K_020303 [Fragaria x ananassa]
MILLNHYDGFSDIVVVPLDFVWIWVAVSGLPPGWITETSVRLIGETIGDVLGVDGQGVRLGNPRVRVSLPLNELVWLSRWVRVSPVDVLELFFRYERLLGRCRDCAMINHGGLRCSSMVVVEAVLVPPSKSGPEMVFRSATSSSGLLTVPASPLNKKDKKDVSIWELPENVVVGSRVSGMRR